MKIEKGSGADKFWTGILSVPLILEILWIVRKVFSLEFQQFIINTPKNDIVFGYFGLVMLGIMWVFMMPSSSLIDQFFIENSLYYKIILFTILTLPFLIFMLPTAIIVTFFFFLGKGLFFVFLMIKDYPSKFLNFINNWANDRF